jgi:hypothetical protein
MPQMKFVIFKVRSAGIMRWRSGLETQSVRFSSNGIGGWFEIAYSFKNKNVKQ